MSAHVGGARRIFIYNWPIFVGTWTSALIAGAAILTIGAAGLGRIGQLLAAVTIVGGLWSIVALVVSHYVYDRSILAGASWVPPLLPAGSRAAFTWAAIDAGLDAEVALDHVIAAPCAARLDIHDGTHVGSPSVGRARSYTPRQHHATRASAIDLPLAERSYDLIAVIFTAHEIKTHDARQTFFVDVARALASDGRLLLVEHVRDVANVLAYGPGAWHFQPRREWLALARGAGLRVAREQRVTPWVTAFAFERVA